AQALLSIAYQLAQHLPEYERRLQKVELEKEAEKNALTIFDNLIVQPLGEGFTPPDGPRIVVIDGIDEATQNGRNEIAEFIATYWEYTPDWLRLIITSRPDEREILASLSGLQPHHMDTNNEKHMEDLRDYLKSGLAERSLIADDGKLTQILNLSEGYFL